MVRKESKLVVTIGKKLRIVITGSGGQLGQAIYSNLNEKFDITLLSKANLNILDLSKCKDVIYRLKPNYVINCSAKTNVKLCENLELSDLETNYIGPLNLAKVSSSINATLVHFSTDYVFSGRENEALIENQKMNPLNKYGLSKKMGEEMLIDFGYSNVIINRTSWLYSEYGNNFAKTIIKKALSGDVLGIVDDQFGCPSEASNVADQLEAMLNIGLERGIFHICNKDVTTWFEFARELLLRCDLEQIPINKITSEQVMDGVNRPKTTALIDTKFSILGIDKMKNWKQSVIEVAPRIRAAVTKELNFA